MTVVYDTAPSPYPAGRSSGLRSFCVNVSLFRGTKCLGLGYGVHGLDISDRVACGPNDSGCSDHSHTGRSYCSDLNTNRLDRCKPEFYRRLSISWGLDQNFTVSL